MTRAEMKEYLESLHNRWHTTDENWEHFMKEGKLGSDQQFDNLYNGCSSINGDKDAFVNSLLRKLYPTKLDKALK